MSAVGRNPTVRLLERELEEEYARAITFLVRYGSGLDRARQAYRRLCSFREALAHDEERVAQGADARRQAA